MNEDETRQRGNVHRRQSHQLRELSDPRTCVATWRAMSTETAAALTVVFVGASPAFRKTSSTNILDRHIHNLHTEPGPELSQRVAKRVCAA